MATTVNHDMDQGTNFAFTILAKDGNNIPIDLSSGYTAHAQMRKYYSSSSYVTLTASITGTTGNITVSLGPTATAAIKDGTWFYDVELHSNNGSTVQRVVQGMITVYPEVTKL
jgi:hypothetical protein